MKAVVLPRRLQALVVGILLGVLAALSLPAPAGGNPIDPRYPHGFIYGGVRSSGWPLLDYKNPAGSVPYPPLDTAINVMVARRMARNTLVCIDAAPAIPWRQDMLTAIRNRMNEDGKLVIYVLAMHYFFAQGGANQDIPTMFYDAIQHYNGVVYGTDNAQWLDNYTVNWGIKALADSLTTIYIERILSNPAVDGIFLDCFNAGGIGWTDGAFGRTLDVARMGFATKAQADSAFTVNGAACLTRLRAAYPNKLILTNGATPGGTLEGRMQEAFPALASPPTWTQAVTGPGGYLANDALGWYNTIKLETGVGNGYTSTSMAEAAWVLGTAALGHGYATYGYDRTISSGVRPSYPELYYDEMSVITSFGDTPAVADTSGKHAGWLGYPTTAPAQDAGGMWYRKFTNGIVLINPNSAGALTYHSATKYKKITGIMDPTRNNGAIDTTFTVNGRTALFLQTWVAAPSTLSTVFRWFLGVFR